MQRSVRVAEPNSVDTAGVTDAVDTKLTCSTEAVKGTINVIGVDDIVTMILRVGNCGKVDHGIAALESLEEAFVVAGTVRLAHFAIGDIAKGLLLEVDLDRRVACVRNDLDNLLAKLLESSPLLVIRTRDSSRCCSTYSATSSGNSDLHACSSRCAEK